ncbi:MAG: YaiO family outer membrane beta-barrel protein [Bacteroidota bacterium]
MKQLLKPVIILLVFAAQSLLSQVSIDSLGAEELYFLGREFAFAGQRDSSRMLLKRALEKSPDYADIRILLARTFAWDGRHNEAREELKSVLSKVPDHQDALSAAVDVEMWDNKLPEALTICNEAIRIYPSDESFLVRRVKIYRDMNRNEEALVTISMLEEINQSNAEIRPLRESIATKGILNSAGAIYTFDHFSQRFDPQQLLNLQYSRLTELGTFIGRMNIVDRFLMTAMQFEFDVYPRIVPGVYGFFNYGYSSSTLFPEHRIGVEIFFKLPENFEGSVGLRYLSYAGGSDVTIYTGSIGMYYEQYWFSLRPYITPGPFSFSQSLSFTVRRYIGGEGDYASFRAGGGASPDEDRIIDTIGTQFYNLKLQTIGVGYQYVVNYHSLVHAMIDLTRQELPGSAGNYMNIVSLTIGYKYKF